MAKDIFVMNGEIFGLKPYTSFDKFGDRSAIAVGFNFDDRFPDEYKRFQYDDLRRNLGERLVDFLERFQSPCVVEIVEIRKPHRTEFGRFPNEPDYFEPPGEFVELRAYVENVRFMSSHEKTFYPPTLWQRIKYTFTGNIDFLNKTR